MGVLSCSLDCKAKHSSYPQAHTLEWLSNACAMAVRPAEGATSPQCCSRIPWDCKDTLGQAVQLRCTALWSNGTFPWDPCCGVSHQEHSAHGTAPHGGDGPGVRDPWTCGDIGSSDTSTAMNLSSLVFPPRERLGMKEEWICGAGLSLLEP